MKKIVFIYSILLFSITVFSYAFIDPHFFYLQKFYSGFAFDKRQITTIIYIFIILSFYLFYLMFLRIYGKNKISVLNLKWLISLTVGILLLSYPAMLSYDIFNYTTTSKVVFHYLENPYIVMPIEFTNDNFLLYTRAANKYALYGPMWILLTGIPYFLSFGNLLLNMIVLKFFVSLFYIGSIILIWKISRNIYSVLLFALNPLIVIETLVSSHNDIVMMFLSLFSFYLLKKKKVLPAWIFLLVSILIKYSTLFLIPVFIYVVLKIVNKKNINWDRIFFYASLGMLLIFLLSPIREEIYSWYFIWFLVFASLLPKRKLLLGSSILLSFGLMLRYIPFMFLGTYFGPTPYLKEILTFSPIILLFLYKFLCVFAKHLLVKLS